MCYTWENGLHLRKWILIAKKLVTLAKMGHTCKNGLHLLKWVTYAEMGDTCKNGSHVKKCVIRKTENFKALTSNSYSTWVTLAKSVLFANMGHT